MSAHLNPIARITERATDALLKEIGVVDTIRFLSQFRIGSGDYTVQREKLFSGLSVTEISKQIRAQRESAGL